MSKDTFFLLLIHILSDIKLLLDNYIQKYLRYMLLFF